MENNNSEKKLKAFHMILKITQLQVTVCALIFVCAVAVKVATINRYETVKVGAFNAAYKVTNVQGLNNKIDFLSEKNNFLAFLFGRLPSKEKQDTKSTQSPTQTAETTQQKEELVQADAGKYEIPILDEIAATSGIEYDDSPDYLELPDGQFTLPQELILPVVAPITSPFGQRIDPFTKKQAYHTGTDFGIKTGTKISAAMDGTIKVGKSVNGGNYIVITHSNGFTTYYGHLSKYLVKNGDKVKAGDSIALSGSTGKVTGPHLHFEIRKDGKAFNVQDYVSI